ncbi:Pentatricopeptide repeat-containing protein [Platanthera zijinensis]|uniref:Pentatricopeptide repeat-containing protein n=1 Tax=Platanthera zijinensis TaxID=2320716 RepID=A0AAP0BIL1_9ASPA
MKAHSQLLKLGLDTNPVAVTQLLQAYARQSCLSSLASARQLFDDFPSSSRDIFLWAAIISAFARSPVPVAAIHLLVELLRLPSPPTPLSFAFASSARAAASVGDPLLARSLHAQVIRRHVLPNVVVATSLLDMYSKCSSLGFARKVFDGMPHRNVVTWNSIIAAYASGGMNASALELFHRVKCAERDLEADEFAVASAMSACAALNDLRSGMQIHGYSVTAGLNMDPAVANATIKMYFRCREVGSAEIEFEGREACLHSQILMIKGYVFNEKYVDAARSIRRADGFVGLFMEDHSIALSVLSAAANLGWLRLGKQVHGIILTFYQCSTPISMENDDDAVLGNALIDMYCRCSCMSEAWLVFNNLKERNPSHWNALMSGCIYNGLLDEAHRLLDEMPFRNVISWTSMISGYVQHGSPRKGLHLLSRLYNEEGFVRGNSFTFATALDACSSLASLNAGKQIHAQVLRTSDTDGRQNVAVQTALVDMYSRSGNLGHARKIFDGIQNMNVQSWTSMITGYATHGFASEAIELFEDMVSKGFVPNEVTFVSVLSVCSRCGLIEQGMQYFGLMGKYGIIAPRGDHYACLVDMLGRAGKLAEARDILLSINGSSETKSYKKCRANGEDAAATWGALLGGCKLYGNVEMGSEVAREMMSRKHQASGSLVALSNLYAFSGDWDAVYTLRKEGKRGWGFIQKPGHSIA